MKDQFKLSIHSALQSQPTTKKSTTSRSTNKWPPLNVRIPTQNNNMVKTKVGILPNISPAVISTLCTTNIASGAQVSRMLVDQTNMKGVKVSKDARKLTPGGTATCYAGKLQQASLAQMAIQKIKLAETLEKKAKQQAE